MNTCYFSLLAKKMPACVQIMKLYMRISDLLMWLLIKELNLYKSSSRLHFLLLLRVSRFLAIFRQLKIARKHETLSCNKECSLFYCFNPFITRSAFMAMSTVLISKDRHNLL